jgi:Domain of unknown function (DUF5667)
MNKRHRILAGIMIALLCCAGIVTALGDNSTAAQSDDSSISADSAPYNGSIGPESPLFGLKVALENLDETFTFNDTQRVEKQVDHAQTRIVEARQEFALNKTGYAERSLDLYRQKLNQTELSIVPLKSNETGLLHAQELITRHQTDLSDLLALHPDSTGLARAYSNNLALEQKFGEKTQMRFDRSVGKNNKSILTAVKRDIRIQNHAGGDNTTPVGTITQDRNENQDRIKGNKNDIPVNTTVIIQHATPRDNKGSAKDQGKNEGN